MRGPTSELSRAEGVGLNELLAGGLQESEVEHWKERAVGLEIVLAVGGDEADADRVLAIEITADGKVEFAEQCDSWFGVAVTPEIAIAALEEAIAWIRANAKEPANV